MRFIDLLSVISGLASIISLAFSVWDRFATWRKYVLPLAWGLAGANAFQLNVPDLSSNTDAAEVAFGGDSGDLETPFASNNDRS